LLAALAVVRGLLYASFVPPWQAPDEPSHFERARAAFSAQEWTATSTQNPPPWYQDIIESLYQTDYYNFMPAPRPATTNLPLNQYIGLYQEIYQGLYGSRPAYIGMGWPLLAAPDNILLQLYLLRLNSVLFFTGVILLAYGISRTIFPNTLFMALGVPLLILFNPQHTHIFATVNNGNLAELFTLAAIFLLVRAIMGRFTWQNVAGMVVFTILATWTKATAYFLPFAFATVGLVYAWRYRRKWRLILPAGLLLVAVTIWFMPERLKILLGWSWDMLRAGQFHLNPIVPRVMFGSFFAMPGWMTIQLDRLWYQLLALLVALALAGLVLLLIRHWRKWNQPAYRPAMLALAVLAVMAAAAIAAPLMWSILFDDVTYRQGRSIFPAIVSVYVFLLLGWRQLIPANWRVVGLLGMVGLAYLFDTMVLFKYIIPYFYSGY